MSRRVLLLALAPFMLLAGCATAPSDPAARAAFRENNDPLEPLNRKVFAVNQAVDRALLKPIAKGYVRAIPQGGRDSIRNFLANVHDPVVLVNNLLQAQFKRAGITLGRFLINTTAGIAGFADVAKGEGLPEQTGDLGQTFLAWGVPEGPYLVLPLLGPSNPRDAAGIGLQVYLDPFRYVASDQGFPSVAIYAPIVVDGIDLRSRNIDSLNAIEKDAIDYYASLRSLYRQDRAAQLRGDATPVAPQPEGLYDDPGAGTPEKAEPVPQGR
jgi:phospholipid-binding lipoprotein MlaA